MTLPTARPRGSLAAFFVAGAMLAQQSAVIQTETRVVLVDAIVTGRNGAYVRDLAAKDFRVWEDNREQTIKSFALETASTAAQPRPMVLFFDESSMETGDQIALRQAASRFIDAEMGPNRKMAVVSYNGALRIGQNFTDNAGHLKDALPEPESRVPTDETRDPPSAMRRGLSNANAIDDAASRNMLHALRNLGESLGVLPGRKIIVLFSGPLPSTSAERSDMREAIEACNKSGVAIYPVDVRPVSTPAQPDRTNPFDYEGRSARLGGPQGDRDDSIASMQDPGAASQQVMYGLAGGTGGFVIKSSNDLLGGLQKIAEEQDQYYVISYTPPESKEGACHALRVKVDRSGTNVRARSSYCTSKPQDLLAGTTSGQDLEKRAMSETGAGAGDMTASIALPYFYTSPGVARVNVAMEIVPGALKFENQKGKLHAEINLLGIASTVDGGVRARFSDNLKFDFDNEAQIQSWRVRPLHYAKEFRIAPGEYSFTMAFGQTGQTAFGKVEMPLKVDPWTAGELALSGIVLSRETHPAADLGLSLATGGRTPLVAEGTEVVPSGSSLFTRSEAGFFYFELYSPDPPSVSVQVRVLDRRTGESKWDSGPTKIPQPATGGMPSIPASARLPLNALTAGSYRLEIRASDSAGKQAARTADFDIR